MKEDKSNVSPKAYLEAHDIDLLEEAAVYFRDRLLIRLLFHLGCRVSEAITLEVKDVSFDICTVTIQHLKSRTKLICPECKARLSRGHNFCSKCGIKVKEAIAREQEHRRMRTIPLDSQTLGMLREFIERGGPVEKNGKRLIFGINRHRAWQMVNQCAAKAGLQQLINPETGKTHSVSPHRLRDAFAVHAVKQNDSGDGLRLLQEHLGHASFNTTAKYRKVAGEELKDWYNNLWNGKEASGGTETT